MTVNGYVQWFDELRGTQWETFAEFKYYDDAIAFAKTQFGTVRAMRGAEVLWHSDSRRLETIETR